MRRPSGVRPGAGVLRCGEPIGNSRTSLQSPRSDPALQMLATLTGQMALGVLGVGRGLFLGTVSAVRSGSWGSRRGAASDGRQAQCRSSPRTPAPLLRFPWCSRPPQSSTPWSERSCPDAAGSVRIRPRGALGDGLPDGVTPSTVLIQATGQVFWASSPAPPDVRRRCMSSGDGPSFARARVATALGTWLVAPWLPGCSVRPGQAPRSSSGMPGSWQARRSSVLRSRLCGRCGSGVPRSWPGTSCGWPPLPERSGSEPHRGAQWTRQCLPSRS